MSSLSERVKEAFAFLASKGYAIVSETDEGMGGGVTYRSPDVWIEIDWDRGGALSLEFASTHSSWYGRVPWDNIDHHCAAPHDSNTSHRFFVRPHWRSWRRSFELTWRKSRGDSPSINARLRRRSFVCSRPTAVSAPKTIGIAARHPVLGSSDVLPNGR